MTGYNGLTELWQPVRAPDSGVEITEEEEEEDEEGQRATKKMQVSRVWQSEVKTPEGWDTYAGGWDKFTGGDAQGSIRSQEREQVWNIQFTSVFFMQQLNHSHLDERFLQWPQLFKL